MMRITKISEATKWDRYIPKYRVEGFDGEYTLRQIKAMLDSPLHIQTIRIKVTRHGKERVLPQELFQPGSKSWSPDEVGNEEFHDLSDEEKEGEGNLPEPTEMEKSLWEDWGKYDDNDE